MTAGEEPGARNAQLLEWYEATRRDLPWRHITDPYRVLVSEIMLQQTQAARVIPYYERFVAAFPTVDSLAAADLATVMGLWSGLGYNSRAKRLRDAARSIAAHGWPDDLTELPGVGPYTAAAVACFAHGAQVPAVDTNLRRVISRWEGNALDGEPLARRAAALLDEDASAWNQAVMDLGARICRPRPRCGECPVGRWCADPSIYAPPRRQGPFEGSERQVRGAIIRALVNGPRHERELATATGFDSARVQRALRSLREEHLVEGPPYRLAR